MKKSPSDSESVASDQNKIKCRPPEGKLMHTLRRVLMVTALLQSIRRACQFLLLMAKLIKEWLDPS